MFELSCPKTTCFCLCYSAGALDDCDGCLMFSFNYLSTELKFWIKFVVGNSYFLSKLNYKQKSQVVCLKQAKIYSLFWIRIYVLNVKVRPNAWSENN